MNSMTGFGKSQKIEGSYQVDVELKSVNHRFFDCNFRMPKELQIIENDLKTIIKEKIQRGRVEVYLSYKNDSDDQKELVIHWHLLDELVQQLTLANETRYLNKGIDYNGLMNGLASNTHFFEVYDKKELPERVLELFKEALIEATQALDDSRQLEGNQINTLIKRYLIDFEEQVTFIKAQVPAIEADYRTRLEKRLKQEVGASYEESRLLTELALLIEKGDINEELDRLFIHIKKAYELLTYQEQVGREFDFLIQEMNREVNTTGSKSVNMTIKNAVVQMKTILEKIREQIQNIE